MTNACGCAHDPATWAARVELSCLRQGIPADAVAAAGARHLRATSAAPLGAYAILEELSRREGKAVAPPTVYRTLDFFLEHGFVHKIESLNAYAPCEHLGHAHHGMLLICETCGRSEEIEDRGRDARACGGPALRSPGFYQLRRRRHGEALGTYARKLRAARGAFGNDFKAIRARKSGSRGVYSISCRAFRCGF